MGSGITNILLVDNYDSFTYNIAHSIRKHPGTNLQIIEAGKIQTGMLDGYDRIVFSPGPDLPRTGNIMERILHIYGERKSILGICLGMQAIWLYYGGNLKQLDQVAHGRKNRLIKTGIASRLFDNLPPVFEGGLYHSWIADPEYVPEQISVTVISQDKRIMAIRHKTFDIEAVQFHPESVMTPLGDKMISNWLREY